MVQLLERNPGKRRSLFLEERKEGAEKVLSGRDARASGPSPPPVGENSKSASFRDPGEQHTPAAASLRPGRRRQCLHLSRGRRREKKGAPAKPQTSQRLPGGSGRRGAAGRWKRRDRASRRRPGRWRRLPSPAGARGGKEEAVRSGRRRRLPRTRRGRGQSPSPEPAGPQSRHLPAAPGSAADRCPLARRGSGGWAGSLRPLPPTRGWGRGAVALTWLVRGGRDGHGSGGRGGTGSPGKDWLFRRGAGESGRQSTHSPVSEAAPWTPTRSFSAAAEPPSHYPPPSSAAAAASTSSSSAETPRPLHTLSHHAAGEPLMPHVTSGRRWLGRGRALAGAGEASGRGTPWELVSQNATPRRRRRAGRRPPF